MRPDHEIEPGGQHVAPVERPAQKQPAEENGHHFTPLAATLAEQITSLPQRAGELSAGTSELKIHLSLVLSSSKSVAGAVWDAHKQRSGRAPMVARLAKRRGMPFDVQSPPHRARKGGWGGIGEERLAK